MACQKCGSIIQDGLSVCPVCGSDLTMQSNYKKVQQSNTIQSNNNVINTTTNADIVLKKHKNKFLIVIIILLSIIAIGVVLVVTDTVNFSNKKDMSSGEGRDINTVNDESDTTKKTTTTNKTNGTTTSTLENAKSGENVTLGDYVFTVPAAFEFGISTSEEDARKYYLVRKDASAMITFNIDTLSTSLEDVFNEYKELLQDEKLIEISDEVNDYNGYNYYRIVHKEQTGRNKYKVDVEILMQINDNVYINAYMNEPEVFGEQNYLQIFLKFLESGI